MAEFFFEIRSGEIPAGMQRQAMEALKRILSAFLTEAHLTFDSLDTYVGPRRLVARVTELPLKQPSATVERKGPSIDAPAQAIEGFLKSTGKALDELEKRETPKGTFYFLTEHQNGQDTARLLPDAIRHIIKTFPWPKNMTWGVSTQSWVRPLRGGCAVFDGKPLEFEVSLGGASLPFSNTTVGHRFLAPQPFQVTSFEEYKKKLHQAFVMVDPHERRAEIWRQIQELCQTHSLQVQEDPGLLDEVTGLVEWPVSLLGTIQHEFMTLPPELLRTAMRVHQRYFSVHTTDGAFDSHFIVVANQRPSDGGQAIITGNERVLKARLSDAVFFYSQDRKHSLEDHAKKLSSLIFQARLGTLAQKQERLEGLIASIPGDFPQERKAAQEAAHLAKADLTTEMVFEFPELQGIMGSYYARDDGKDPRIAQAIYDQYTPKGPNDPLPQAIPSQLLGLADRLDTLVGFFSIGLKPTGSKDPFALRRSALGVIRYLEMGFEVTLSALVKTAYELYRPILASQKEGTPLETVLADLEAFFIERLKVYWRDQGYRHDLITAVLAPGLLEPLHVLKKRLEALALFIGQETEAAESLLAGYRRAVNIVRKESAKETLTLNLNPDLLEHTSEKELYKTLKACEGTLQPLLSQRNFPGALSTLAPLRTSIDRFFEDVIVNDDRPQIRTNRLSLLMYLQKVLETVADFSKIEG
jgi:glycyl-tRNA synthetase beta chain